MSKIFFRLSGFLTLMFFILAYLQKNKLSFCSRNFSQCENYLAFLLIFFPVFIFSIFFNIFQKNSLLWYRFTIIFIGIYFLLLIISAGQVEFLQPSRGDLAILLAIIYAAISLVLFVFLCIKNRSNT